MNNYALSASLFDLMPIEEIAQTDLTLPPQYAYDRDKVNFYWF